MPFNVRRSSTRGTPRGLLGSSGDHAPLEVGQVVSAHGEPESAFAIRGKLVVSQALPKLKIDPYL
jgi:hypothetical protein